MGGKATRESRARDRIRAQREADRKRHERRRIVTYALAAVVAVAAVAGGWLYAANQSQSETASGKVAPVTLQPDGSVVMAQPGVEKPVLDIYEDFQCPACKALEETSGTTVKNLAAEGQVKVVFHPITIFSAEPTKSNSVRAGAAARCVPSGQWLAYHDKLFAGQPSEAVEGFKLDELVAWGKEVGVTSPDFDKCVTSQEHAALQGDYTAKVLKQGVVRGTPTVILNGKELGDEAFSPSQLRKAVLDASK
ncbi:membrane protein [Microtetraspora sp. NBRC 13810]|uniref:DsbA family protein n=1 Tax=Microtetraspora sp. NBRC 13810 TaxID=3030990 RepID=UPI0024A4AFAF|nr:thioredoxin domain-containing protein [Microtetraspora sp. NBRC 13810]GLW12234.1 membrane protein [Microtetraspora sp. NBRC 13810]